jgi:hypothetical protein
MVTSKTPERPAVERLTAVAVRVCPEVVDFK